MNINNVSLCPIHTAYETVSAVARELGVEVTGTELIGLIPEECMVEAGQYFAEKQELQLADANEQVTFAVKAMHMEDLAPFDVKERILR
jgi:glutamate formiminotransferase/formiminotetrahydrofolate cyclodeaminase